MSLVNFQRTVSLRSLPISMLGYLNAKCYPTMVLLPYHRETYIPIIHLNFLYSQLPSPNDEKGKWQNVSQFPVILNVKDVRELLLALVESTLFFSKNAQENTWVFLQETQGLYTLYPGNL